MEIQEIKMLYTTLVIDPDEARVLAAACKIAGLHCEGSKPTVNPLEEFGSLALMAILMEACAAMFEAASMRAGVGIGDAAHRGKRSRVPALSGDVPGIGRRRALALLHHQRR